MSLWLGNFGVHRLLDQKGRRTWSPSGTPSFIHPHLPVLGKSPACSLTAVPQLMQPEPHSHGDVAAELLRVVLWGVTNCFQFQFSIPTPSAVPLELGTSLNRDLAMAQLDTVHVLAQPWDQAWESLSLGFQSEESEWKKYILSHFFPPSPPHSELHCCKAGAPFKSPTSSCKQICCPSQPRYPKVSVSCWRHNFLFIFS